MLTETEILDRRLTTAVASLQAQVNTLQLELSHTNLLLETLAGSAGNPLNYAYRQLRDA